MHNNALNKFTQHGRSAVQEALRLAATLGHAQASTAHLLAALIAERGSVAQDILHSAGLSSEALHGRLRRSGLPAKLPASPRFNAATQRVLVRAAYVAHTHAHAFIGTEHVLAALLELTDRELTRVFADIRLDVPRLKERLNVVLEGSSRFPDMSPALELMQTQREEGAESPARAATPSALETFGLELTDPEVVAGIDPVIGRENEIERLIQVLCRRTKNNPVVLGPAGVGKTAIVEGLAKRIVEGSVPELLRDKRMYRLDLAALVAGTSFRGEFEQRVREVYKEASKNPDIILFIDELHTIVGAGAAGGSIDAANLLKPALARGEIRCIGATTPEDYKKYIEPDPALERRFAPVLIQPPDSERALEILRGIKLRYEDFHRLEITDESLRSAVSLAERYLTDRHLPDKAIDLLDEAAASVAMHTPNPAAQTRRASETRLRDLHSAMHQAIEQENFTLAHALRKKEHALQGKLQRETQRSIQIQTQTQTQPRLGRLEPHHIASVIAKTTGIPAHDLLADERTRLLGLEERLARLVIGQPEAIQAASSVIRRGRTGMQDPARPQGSMLFLGPSGVGKTELAKVLAAEVFGSPQALVRIDSSELAEPHSIAKLIGSPAGYVGYREGARLTDAVRARPYSVVLFDEIEKGHPSLWNLLLQLLDEGRLTDSTGRVVSFRHSLIVMTSNIGSLPPGVAGTIGFAVGVSRESDTAALHQLRAVFRPEFLNRIDSTCVFNPLGQTERAAIAKLQLNQLKNRLASQGITLTWAATVPTTVARLAGEAEQGARGVKKIIRDLIENQVAIHVLKTSADTVRITAHANEFLIA